MESGGELEIAGTLRRVAFSPDSSRLLITSDSEIVQFWDTTLGKPLTPLHHGDSVKAATYSADSKLVAVTLSNRGRVIVWNISGNSSTLSNLLSVDDMVEYAELVACRRVDQQGVVSRLVSKEWQSQWDALSARHPKIFASSAPASFPSSQSAGWRVPGGK
jgi:WD40 repeat protein